MSQTDEVRIAEIREKHNNGCYDAVDIPYLLERLGERDREIERLQESHRRLKAIMPLFQEARDAITAITLESAKLRGIRLDLADRMDQIGEADRWKEYDAALTPTTT